MNIFIYKYWTNVRLHISHRHYDQFCSSQAPILLLHFRHVHINYDAPNYFLSFEFESTFLQLPALYQQRHKDTVIRRWFILSLMATGLIVQLPGPGGG